jgi:hypothetical protein
LTWQSTTTRRDIPLSASSIDLVTKNHPHELCATKADKKRTEFALSLQNLSLRYLRKVQMSIFNHVPRNENFSLQSALLPSSFTDHLSLALHGLSQLPLLTNLTLRDEIVLSRCIFWPETPLSPDLPF